MKRLFASLALVLPLVAHAGFDDAVQALRTGDYAKALAGVQGAADQVSPKRNISWGCSTTTASACPRTRMNRPKWF